MGGGLPERYAAHPKVDDQVFGLVVSLHSAFSAFYLNGKCKCLENVVEKDVLRFCWMFLQVQKHVHKYPPIKIKNIWSYLNE